MGDNAARPRAASLVLGGAAARGAFEAGALEVLAASGVGVRRVVVTSSGALNGTAYAAGIRARRETEASRELAQAWEEDASFGRVVHPSISGIVGLRGISDQKRLLALLRRTVRPSTAPDPAPVTLQMVLASLHGRQGRVDGEPATTYQEIVTFSDEAFDDAEALERVFVGAVASAAMPLLFVPVEVPGLGPCTDGGILDNTPILATVDVDDAEAVDAVIVVTPTPALFRPPPQEHRGFRLLTHQLDMVFAERIYQDLRRANRLNEGLQRLDALAAREGWSPDTIAEIKAALDLGRLRPMPILSIRPRDPLPGTLFSGLRDHALRREYVRIGRERAAEALGAVGWG